MPSYKLYLLHLQEITKKALEEDRRQTRLQILIAILVALDLIATIVNATR